MDAVTRLCPERAGLKRPARAVWPVVIDGADGARQMKAFKALVENPLGLVA